MGLESVSDIGSSGLNTRLNSYAHPVERGLRGFRGWMAAKGHLFCMPVHNDLYVCRTYMLFFHVPSRTATEPLDYHDHFPHTNPRADHGKTHLHIEALRRL